MKLKNHLRKRALVGKHIDHSTFGKAFERIPEEYLKKSKNKCHDKLSILSEYYSDAGVICISAGEWRSRL